MNPRRVFLISVTAGVLALAPRLPAAQRKAAPAPAPAALMAAIGAYVERYFASAQRVMATETVTLQPLRPDLTSAEFPRRLEYDLQIEWTPGQDGRAGEAQVHRTLVKVNGRAPRPKDEPGCSDPRATSPEPLAMLLPSRQAEFVFTGNRPGRVARRAVRMVDFRSAVRGTPEVRWTEDCVSIDLPGRTTGRVWADPVTGEVLRLDEHLIGTFDVRVPDRHQRRGAAPTMTLERADMSIRYSPVRFTDPDETVLMPAEVDSLTIIRDAGTPRLRVRQVFTNYRRFLTEGRILPN